jgi:hypothetical protein
MGRDIPVGIGDFKVGSVVGDLVPGSFEGGTGQRRVKFLRPGRTVAGDANHDRQGYFDCRCKGIQPIHPAVSRVRFDRFHIILMLRYRSNRVESFQPTSTTFVQEDRPMSKTKDTKKDEKKKPSKTLKEKKQEKRDKKKK